jgi:hypothetical protein
MQLERGAASNSAGRVNDDHGLIKVESLLHGRADLVADGIDQARLFDPWVQASFPMYGPLLRRGANGETIVWTSSGRGPPSSRYPLTLSAGTIADGALYTIPGKFALGFIHDLSRLSPEFITAVLMSITSGSHHGRRAGTAASERRRTVAVERSARRRSRCRRPRLITTATIATFTGLIVTATTPTGAFSLGHNGDGDTS